MEGAFSQIFSAVQSGITSYCNNHNDILQNNDRNSGNVAFLCISVPFDCGGPILCELCVLCRTDEGESRMKTKASFDKLQPSEVSGKGFVCVMTMNG